MPRQPRQDSEDNPPLTSNSINRPKTRPKNATTHPGTNAQKILSTRRDPEVIEKEKHDRLTKKANKEREKDEVTTRMTKGQLRVEELQAQLVQAQAELDNPDLRYQAPAVSKGMDFHK